MASQVRFVDKLNEEYDIDRASKLLGLGLESRLEDLKCEIIQRIDKELLDSQNARDFVSQKYDELCNKIQYLAELDATVTSFRSDVKTIENQLNELTSRMDRIEKKVISRDCSANASSMF
ncbi:unnamed protein product, partial [Iphiclides podalirius]